MNEVKSIDAQCRISEYMEDWLLGTKLQCFDQLLNAESLFKLHVATYITKRRRKERDEGRVVCEERRTSEAITKGPQPLRVKCGLFS